MSRLLDTIRCGRRKPKGGIAEGLISLMDKILGIQ